MTKLSFGQIDAHMSESFWQKNIWSLKYFMVYAYFNILAQSQILGNSLYV